MIKQMYKVESRDADGKILYQFHIQEIGEAEAIRVGKMYTTKEALAGTWSATKRGNNMFNTIKNMLDTMMHYMPLILLLTTLIVSVIWRYMNGM